MKIMHLLTIILLMHSLTIQAEIILDGTLGSQGPLVGPDYLIDAELGQQYGGNLFHSFQDFNLHSFERATFSGPNTVNNIISRVTGGEPSQINGLLRSNIPNADLYFINPYGIVFGSEAQLDVGGSFHASTADYLRLENGGEFNAREPKNSLLSVAPVEAFGFINQNPASLSIESSQLKISSGKTLSLIGGDITMVGGKVEVAGGEINLASFATPGELQLSQDGLEVSSLSQFGELMLSDNAQVLTSGQGSGHINIRAGQFTLNRSQLNADSLEAGEKGHIHIEVNRLHLEDETIVDQVDEGPVRFETVISSSTISDGEGGDIHINAAESVTLHNAAIFANSGQLERPVEDGNTTEVVSQTQGDAGRIYIETPELLITNSVIESNAFDIGQGGNITLSVSDYTRIDRGHIALNAFEGTDVSADRVGTLLLETGQLDLNEVLMSSSTFGAGAGGHIRIKVKGSMTIIDGKIKVDAKTFKPKPHDSPEAESSPPPDDTQSTGEAGTIWIEAQSITLSDKSKISSSTSGTGDSGNVYIYAIDSISFQSNIDEERFQNTAFDKRNYGIEAVSTSQEVDSGHAGEIWIKTQDLSLSGNIKINTSNSGGGDAGNIHLNVRNLDMSDNVAIASTNRGSGNAGNINIQVEEELHLQNAHLTTEAKQSQGGDIRLEVGELVYSQDSRITTSVRGGNGDGGNINILTPEFIILDDADIKAQANAGRGGNISLISEQFIASPCSLVSASSRLGIDGDVEIKSPSVHLDEFMLVLPTGFKKANITKCDSQTFENPSTFKIMPRFHPLPFH
jgi:filamentous hemagglutinin family protein